MSIETLHKKTCKGCYWKVQAPSNPQAVGVKIYMCTVRGPTLSVFPVGMGPGGMQLANSNGYPQVSDTSPACKEFNDQDYFNNQ